MHASPAGVFVIWPLHTCQELGYQFGTQSISLPPPSFCLTVINEGIRSRRITFSHLPWAGIFVCSPMPLPPPFFHDRANHPAGHYGPGQPPAHLPAPRSSPARSPLALPALHFCAQFPFPQKGKTQPLPAPGAPLFFFFLGGGERF